MKKINLSIIALLIISSVISGCTNNDVNNIQKEEVIAKKVDTMVIDENNNSSSIKTVGTINAEAKIDVTATTRGTVKSINFDTGDEININDVLANLYDSATFTTFNNAQTNLVNMENNFEAASRLAQENIRQAEIGVTQAENGIKQAEIGAENASQSVEAARIALKTQEDNLENSKNLREKTIEDTKKSAVISYDSHLNTIFSALDQVNYLIKAEGNNQLPGIEQTLSVKNESALDNARYSYNTANTNYDKISTKNISTDNINEEYSSIVSLLSQTTTLIDNTIKVLEATVSNSNFSESALIAQKTSFNTLRANVSGAYSGAESTLQALNNSDLVYDKEISALENAVASAKNQFNISQTAYANALNGLESAKTGLANAKQNLENAKQGKEQTISSSQTTLDNAKGQVNLSASQVGDLRIKAPIKGKVTQKYIELGAEINPGQKIAEISQLGNVKIVINLPSQDIYRIKVGQKVIINDGKEAMITSINPSADPITKKVKAEIIIDNSDNKFIQGTFIDVEIPVEQFDKTEAKSIFVPLKSITINQDEKYAFINNNGIAKKVIVETGTVEGAYIEVLSGITNGDELIIEGAKLLEDGDKIEINN